MTWRLVIGLIASACLCVAAAYYYKTRHLPSPTAASVDLSPILKGIVVAKFDRPDDVQFRNLSRPTSIGLCGEASGAVGGIDRGFAAFYAQNTGAGKWMITFDQSYVATMCRQHSG